MPITDTDLHRIAAAVWDREIHDVGDVTKKGPAFAHLRWANHLAGKAAATSAAALAAVGQVDEAVIAGLSAALAPALAAAVSEQINVDIDPASVQAVVEAGVRNVLIGGVGAPPP